jgi:hypothetical protein
VESFIPRSDQRRPTTESRFDPWPMNHAIAVIAEAHAGILTRRQAMTCLEASEVDRRLGREWRVILPGVYATFTGELTNRHRRWAALLHAGDGSMLTDLDALRLMKVPYLPNDPFVRVLVDGAVQRASRDFVLIRRTTRLPKPRWVDGFPVAPTGRALADFVARYDDSRAAFAVAAAAVQTGRASVGDLIREAEYGPARGRPKVVRTINALNAGVRSAPEADFRALVLAQRGLPEPLWNSLIMLPGGQKISPDALFVDAGLVHETNGRDSHSLAEAGEDAFEDMQRRHDLMVTSGLTVLHNVPRRLLREGKAVIAQVVTCFNRDTGRGLPEGVVILRPGPSGTPWITRPNSDVTSQ